MSEKIKSIIREYEKSWGYVPDWVQMLAKYSPQALEGHYTIRSQALTDGALTRKVKELMLVGINAARGFQTPMIAHIRGALDAGATEEEIHETLLVAVATAGIPAYIEGVKALKTVQAEKKKSSQK